MRIGELSRRTGVSQRSLRYYEDQGLLVSSRAPSGQRHYDEAHVAHVRTLQAFLAAGMSSRVVAEMVPCMVAPSVEGARTAVALLARERENLSATIDDLIAARSALDGLLAVNRDFLAEQGEDVVVVAGPGRADRRPAGWRRVPLGGGST